MGCLQLNKDVVLRRENTFTRSLPNEEGAAAHADVGGGRQRGGTGERL